MNGQTFVLSAFIVRVSSRHGKENIRPVSRGLLFTGISDASLLRGQGGEAPSLSGRLVSQKFLANATPAEGLCSRESLLQGSLEDAAEDGSMKAMVMASPMLPPPHPILQVPDATMILAKQLSIDRFLDLDLEKPFVTPPWEGEQHLRARFLNRKRRAVASALNQSAIPRH